MSERRIGTKSAGPWSTAPRLPPVNSDTEQQSPTPVGRERDIPFEVEVFKANVVEVGASAEGLNGRRRGGRSAINEDIHAALD